MGKIQAKGMRDAQLDTVISVFPEAAGFGRKSGAQHQTQAIGWGHLQEEFPGRITEDRHSQQGSGSLGTMWTVSGRSWAPS